MLTYFHAKVTLTLGLNDQVLCTTQFHATGKASVDACDNTQMWHKTKFGSVMTLTFGGLVSHMTYLHIMGNNHVTL